MNKETDTRVVYWEIGNEVYGDWDKAYMTGEEYAKKIGANGYGRDAKDAVDLAIKLMEA